MRARIRAPLTAAAGVVLVAMIAAAVIWRDAQARQRGRFDAAATVVEEIVRDRLHAQVALLHGAAGLFAAAPRLSCRQFADFVERMDLEENYPGSLGIGFSIRTDAAGAAAVEAAARADGLRSYRIWPDAPRTEYHVVRCLEPLDRRNRVALGYDMFTDPVRREAMSRARDTGRAALSGRVQLVQEIDPVKQAGFLMYMPVYTGDTVPRDPEARRASLLGFVYSPLRGADFLEDTLGGAAPLVAVEVFDGDAVEAFDGDGLAEAALLHRRAVAPSSDFGPIVRTIDVAGRRWTLRFRPAAAAATAPTRRLVGGVLTSGVLLAFLLFLALSRAQQSAAEAARAEARARESSELAARGAEQLALIMDAVPALVSFIDADRRYVIVNRRFEEWFGLQRSAVEGRPAAEILGAEAFAAMGPAMARALGGEPASTEASVQNADGTARHVLASYMPHRDRHGAVQGAVGLVADITDLMRAKDALAASEANLREILNASLDAVVQMDTGGRVIFWNPRAEEIFGWTEQEARHRYVRDLIVPPALREAHRTGVERFLRTGEGPILGTRIEVAALRKDGREMPVELSVTAIGAPGEPRFNAFISDLSARRRASAARRFLNDAAVALSSSLDRDRTLGMIATLAVPQLAGGAVVVTNAASGAAAAGHAGSMSAHDAAAWADRLGREPEAAPPPGGGHDQPAVLPLSAGTHRMGWLVLEGPPAQPGPAEDDRAVIEEYARRASMALYNADLYDQAQTANRLKDEFLSTLSHELRTPANAILGWAQMARDSLQQGRDATRALDAVLRNARAQNDLISDILDAQRLATGHVRLEFSAVDLGAVLRQAIDAVRPTAVAKQIDIDAALDSAWPVLGDADRLQQVFWNLLSNAIKFTPEGGAVTVTGRAHDLRITVEIVDTGLGIPSDFLPHMFERFRQADASTTKRHGGLGLGLAIARNLVELHGGTIEAANRADGRSGASFLVHLPRRAADPA